MKKIIAIGLVLILSGCRSYEPDDFEEDSDERMVKNAHELCENHGGVFYYFVNSFKWGESYIVECFDETQFNLRTKEEL